MSGMGCSRCFEKTQEIMDLRILVQKLAKQLEELKAELVDEWSYSEPAKKEESHADHK